MIKISPSIISADLADLRATLRALENGGADMIHFDLEDGSFVPALGLGARIIQAARPLTGLPFDVHLMVQNPEWLIPELAGFGANRVAVHYEACPYPRRMLGLITGLGMQAGLAFNPATPVPPLQFCRPFLSFVVVLTTEPEGKGCPSFLPSVLAQVTQGRAQAGLEGVEWAVDGGVTPENARQVCQAGAQVLVAGRGVFQGGTIAENIAGLRAQGQAGEAEYSHARN